MHDQEIEEKIGSSMVGFINAYIPEGDVGWESFMRIRVELDIQKPLPKGCFINGILKNCGFRLDMKNCQIYVLTMG